MKALIIHQASDGTRFDDQHDCLKYEAQCDRIQGAMKLLRPIPKDDGCSFANGGGYIQQEKPAVLEAYGILLDVAAEAVGQEIVMRIKNAGEFLPQSIIGRYIDDSGHRALNSAWRRFCHMDGEWREWGQSYYARNPKEGKNVAL